MQSLPVITVAEDVSRSGGGVAAVTSSLHRRLACRWEGSQLVSGENGSMERLNAAFEKPCVAHIHGLWTGFVTRSTVAALRAGRSLVLSPHGMLEPWAMGHKSFKKRVAWNLYQKTLIGRADLLIVNSFREYRHVRELGINVPTAVIPNGVNYDVDPNTLTRRDTRKTVLFLSRIAPGKGVSELIHAWRKLPDTRGYRLRVVGDGEASMIALLNGEIERLGLADSVTLEPGQYGVEKWQTFIDADLFILPSHSENFGIVVAEALSAGLPVITTDQTPWEILEQEKLGWITSKDPTSLVKVLKTALGTPSTELGMMGVRASAFAQREFCWDSISDRYLEAYSWLRDKSSRPSWLLLD